MRSNTDLMLCEYFTELGELVTQIYVVDSEDAEAATKAIKALKSREADFLFEKWKTDAEVSGASTNLDQGAMAVEALIYDVVTERTPIAEAREVASVSVNFRKAVTIVDVMPALEASAGGNAVCWARAIFKPLNLGVAEIH